MRISIGVIAIMFSLVVRASAAEYTFVDVPVWNSYYSAVKSLFDNGILIDDTSHKFKPDELLTRDVFAGFTLGSACNFCLNPSIDLIAQYQSSIFPDVTPESPYYYCISQASKDQIIPWYPLGQNATINCQNNETYSVPAYCKNNSVTRIEAVKALLLESNLWNDEMNKNPIKNITITDISENLYGYAKKGIQAGILSLSNDGKVNPDAPITRWEFASMTAKIFDFNQCIGPSNQNTSWSSITIIDNNGKPYYDSTIGKGSNFTIKWQTQENAASNFSWKAIDSITGKELNFTGPSFTTDSLGAGSWFIKLSVFRKSTNEKVSTSSITLTLSDGTQVLAWKIVWTNSNWNAVNGVLYPSLIIEWTPNSLWAGWDVSFSTYSNSSGSLKYIWDFWDGTRITTNSGKVSHTFSTPGTYMTNVIATDALGKRAGWSVVTVVTGSLDSDKDGIPDSSDICPLVQWNSTNWCPKLETNLYTAWAFFTANNSKIGNSIWFSAVDNTNQNSNNSFSNWMPSLGSTTDTDNDGIDDSLDACPTTSGSQANWWCPLVWSFLGNIEKNSCVMDQIGQHGGIIIEPICESCPCPTSISLGNNIRRCDVIFPAILSKDLSEIYSRWPLYQIP